MGDSALLWWRHEWDYEAWIMEQLERETSKVRTSQDVLLDMLSPTQAQALVLVRGRMAEDAEAFNSRTKHSGTEVLPHVT